MNYVGQIVDVRQNSSKVRNKINQVKSNRDTSLQSEPTSINISRQFNSQKSTEKKPPSKKQPVPSHIVERVRESSETRVMKSANIKLKSELLGLID